MSWSFQLSIICYLYLIRCIVSQCNYVAIDWALDRDQLTSDLETDVIFRIYNETTRVEDMEMPETTNLNVSTMTNSTTSNTSNTSTISYITYEDIWYLPSIPRLAMDIYNESYSKVPYPIGQCIQSADGQQSFMFSCANDGPQIFIWDKNGECDGLKFVVDLPESYDYECNEEASCQYISVREEYYTYNESLTDPEDECNFNRQLIDQSYSTSYAVDVCLIGNDGQTSYKYSCDNRTKTYAVTVYSNTQCVPGEGTQNLIDSMDIDDGLQCVDEFEIGVSVDMLNETDPYIEYAKATFIDCTAEDVFTQTLKDYCVSSQVLLTSTADGNGQTTPTGIGQTGPFGIKPVSGTSLSIFSCSNPCDIATCSNLTNLTDATIVYIDKDDTEAIIDGACTKQLVMDLQDTKNINGIIFTTEADGQPISELVNGDDNDIKIPTRIVSAISSTSITKRATAEFSLQCDYEDGYPTEVCVVISCDPAKLTNTTTSCPYIPFAGTYLIQNITNQSYNSNPVYIKQGRPGFDPMYIWLEAVSAYKDAGDVVAQISNYTELRWVISTKIGDSSEALFCVISDPNIVESYTSSNFDVSGCQWMDAADVQFSVTNVESHPYQCFNGFIDEEDLICVSTYQSFNISKYTGTYYEVAEQSSIYIQNDTDSSYVGVLSKEADKAWILRDAESDDIKAFCNITDLESSFVESCYEWYINVGNEFMRDSSFDIDIYECSEDTDDDNIIYDDLLCFQLNNTEQMIYSQVQYLWGEYEKLDEEMFVFDNKPIYANTRLRDTDYETYLLWYDPKDSWVFLTKSGFASNASVLFETETILEDFEYFVNFDNISNIVAWCEYSTDDAESSLPQECEGWLLGGREMLNTTELALISWDRMDEPCTGLVNDNVNFTKDTNGIQDICFEIYEVIDDCELPQIGESTATVTLQQNQETICENVPQHFLQSDWCTGDLNDCETISGNGIYGNLEDTVLISDRSYWIHTEKSYDNPTDIVLFYLYYDEYLRLWIWATDEGVNVVDVDVNSTDVTYIENFDDLRLLSKFAWCLKWDLNEPVWDEKSNEYCDRFYYAGSNFSNQHSNSLLENCSFNNDGSEDAAGFISAIVIASCFGIACCVFVLGFYKEYMEKRQKIRMSRRSILSQTSEDNTTEVALASQLDVNQPAPIEEEKSDDAKNDEIETLKPSKARSASSTDYSVE